MEQAKPELNRQYKFVILPHICISGYWSQRIKDNINEEMDWLRNDIIQAIKGAVGAINAGVANDTMTITNVVVDASASFQGPGDDASKTK